MSRLIAVVAVVLVAALQLVRAGDARGTAQAQAGCQFVLGFGALRDLIGPETVGECLEDQRFAANGNAEQLTTRGLLVWRKADNWTAFTDGFRTWLNGPYGLQQRLNSERYEWEGPDPPAAPPAPLPVPQPAPAPAPAAPGLDRAMQTLLNSQYGDIAVLLRNRNVVIAFGEIPSVANWNPVANRITVSSRYQSASPEALAAVLVHEGTHAQDHFRGLGFATAQDCFDRELHAFGNSAQFWRALHGPAGKPVPADELEADLNRILRVTTERPTNYLEELLALYRHQCGDRPATIPTRVATPLPTPLGLPPIPPSAATVSALELQANDLVYDRGTGRVYASVPGAGGQLGNSLAVIDPTAGAVVGSIPVGSEPGKLALSHDGQFLYVGLGGSGAVRRVHLPSGAPDLQFSVGSGSGPMFVQDMVVHPTNPHTVAIARMVLNSSTPGVDVAIYDDGVMRPKTGTGNSIAFSPDGTRLYGYNNQTTGYDFTRMAVDETGLTRLDSAGNLLIGFYLQIEQDAGLLYASSGRVIDPESRTLVGQYPGMPDIRTLVTGVRAPLSTIIHPDSSVNRTFILVGNRVETQTSPTTMQVLVFDQKNFTLAATIEVPAVVGRVRSLTRWGADGLALSSSGGQVFLVRSPAIAGR